MVYIQSVLFVFAYICNLLQENLVTCFPPGASRAESDYAGPLSADGADAAVSSVVALLQGDGGSEEPCAHVSVRREGGRG